MRRDQLEHAVRTACQIIGHPEVIVVGSQSILGSFREEDLPADATMSIEVDILPIADDNDETARLADLNFVAALLDARLVDPDEIARRLPTVDDRHRPATDRAATWLGSRTSH